MAIDKLTEFAKNGEKSTSGLSLTDGFPRAEKPARQWFNWLFNQLTSKTNEITDALNKLRGDVDGLVLETYKVGDPYITTINHANAAAVAAHHGYGTWERFGEGRVLVGLSTGADAPTWTKTIGKTFGVYEHQLSVEEMPSHKHSQNDVFNKFSAVYGDYLGSSYSDNPENTAQYFDDDISQSADELVIKHSKEWNDAQEQTIGNNKPHNNQPPSIVVAMWLRTA